MKTIYIPNRRGKQLALHSFNPEGNEVIIIVPAMGVLQHFYHDFAIHLTGKGKHVITFDYSGIGM